jgi:hypothetical protein
MKEKLKMSNPYENWECFKYQMYVTRCDDWENLMVQCAEFLSSEGLRETMHYIVENWEVSARHHLEQGPSTWRPWLGHSSCCFEFGVPNWVTKKAWHLMSRDFQVQANAYADDAKAHWISLNGDHNGQDLLI